MLLDGPLHRVKLLVEGQRCVVGGGSRVAADKVAGLLLADAREELRARGRSSEQAGCQEGLDSGMLDLIRAGRVTEARERLRACLSSSSA